MLTIAVKNLDGGVLEEIFLAPGHLKLGHLYHNIEYFKKKYKLALEIGVLELYMKKKDILYLYNMTEGWMQVIEFITFTTELKWTE